MAPNMRREQTSGRAHLAQVAPKFEAHSCQRQQRQQQQHQKSNNNDDGDSDLSPERFMAWAVIPLDVQGACPFDAAPLSAILSLGRLLSALAIRHLSSLFYQTIVCLDRAE
jgi:hypothetical protein